MKDLIVLPLSVGFILGAAFVWGNLYESPTQTEKGAAIQQCIQILYEAQEATSAR